MCGQHNVRASVGDSTGQNTDKGHTPNPRLGIKIPESAGNRTRVAGLEGRDSTDHATATYVFKYYIVIYTGRDNLCIFSNDTMYVFHFQSCFFFEKKKTYKMGIQCVCVSVCVCVCKILVPP